MAEDPEVEQIIEGKVMKVSSLDVLATACVHKVLWAETLLIARMGGAELL